MEPDIKVNTCIIIKETDVEDIQIGDIICFRSLETEIYGAYNTHRVYDIQINERTGEKEYITKGDAFEYPDRLPVTYENILGKLCGKVPYSSKISVLVEKLANNKIYFVVIILPLVCCLLSYIYQLIRLIIYGIEDEDDDEDDDEDEDEYNDEDKIEVIKIEDKDERK
jgi:signal peptidase I